MNILALDTSGRHISLALCTEKGLILEINERVEDTVSQCLPDLFKSHIEPVVGDLSSIDALGVCCGPGPFTSIRIGLTVCKALIVSYGLAFCPINSLKAMARPYLEIVPDVVALMDARRGECYAAVYQHYNGNTIERIAPRIVPGKELVEWVLALPRQPLVVSLLPHTVESELLAAGIRVQRRDPFLAKDILYLTQSQSSSWLHDSQALLPLYLREPDAVVGRSAV